jgi:hypothetical protein
LFCGKISMEEIFGDSRYVGGYVYCLHMWQQLHPTGTK